MHTSMNLPGETGAVGSGNRVGPGINYKLLSMPGLDARTPAIQKLAKPARKGFLVGDTIRGWDLTDKKWKTGEVVEIERGKNNEILNYIILDAMNKKTTIDSRGATLRENGNGINEELKITGGVGEHLSADEVDGDQLSVGILVEMEHTNDPKIAERIAIDHLYEHPQYYTKLIGAGLVDEKDAIELAKELGIIPTDMGVKENHSTQLDIMDYDTWVSGNL